MLHEPVNQITLMGGESGHPICRLGVQREECRHLLLVSLHHSLVADKATAQLITGFEDRLWIEHRQDCVVIQMSELCGQ